MSIKYVTIKTVGFDPHYFPRDFHGRYRSDVVFLNYVLNVIDNPLERKDVLIDAVMLSIKNLLIAVQPIKGIKDINKCEEFSDGIITKRNVTPQLFSGQWLLIVKSYQTQC